MVSFTSVQLIFSYRVIAVIISTNAVVVSSVISESCQISISTRQLLANEVSKDTRVTARVAAAKTIGKTHILNNIIFRIFGTGLVKANFYNDTRRNLDFYQSLCYSIMTISSLNYFKTGLERFLGIVYCW